MGIPVKNLEIFEELQQDELDMVSNYAKSLIRNRVPHTTSYLSFRRLVKECLQRIL